MVVLNSGQFSRQSTLRLLHRKLRYLGFFSRSIWITDEVWGIVLYPNLVVRGDNLGLHLTSQQTTSV
jgi:hypothetical protein